MTSRPIGPHTFVDPSDIDELEDEVIASVGINPTRDYYSPHEYLFEIDEKKGLKLFGPAFPAGSDEWRQQPLVCFLDDVPDRARVEVSTYDFGDVTYEVVTHHAVPAFPHIQIALLVPSDASLRVPPTDGILCQDCVMFVANGDLPEDDPDRTAEEYLADFERHTEGGSWGLGDHEYDYNEFSNRDCDGCGTHLAGSRLGAWYIDG